jgi:hypothetical protein
MYRRIGTFWASSLLRLSQRLWRRGHDVLALELALIASRRLDTAKVVAATMMQATGELEKGIPLLEAAARAGSWEAKQVLCARYLHGAEALESVEERFAHQRETWGRSVYDKGHIPPD